MDGSSSHLYSYPWYTKYPLYLFSMFLALLNLFLIGQLVFQLGTWYSSGTINGSSIGGLLIVLSILGFTFALCSNAYPNIMVYSEGLKIQVFIFWWVFVPWAEVDTMWTVGLVKKSYVVAVKKLTTFHRIIGWGYGSLKPVFPIDWIMANHKQLIKIIGRNIHSQ